MINMHKRYQTLLSNTFLISIGTFGSKLLSFCMIRFYTGALTPSDYGTADLIMQTANLIAPFISVAITDSVFRFALSDSLGCKNVFSVGVYTISAGALLLAVVSVILSVFYSSGDAVCMVAVYTISSCCHSLCAEFIRAQGKTALFAGQGILNTALVAGLSILFLAGFQWGVRGYISSIALADITCSVYLICKEKLWRQLVLHPGKKAWKRMLGYSIPLIPTTVFWWIISVSDRYMITAFLGSDANGLYTVACKIPTMLTLVSGVFLQAWVFSALMESGRSEREQADFYSKIWGAFSSFMFLVCSAVIAFSKLEIRLLSTPAYYEAWKYIPALAIAMILSAFVTFMGSVYIVKEKSTLSFWTAMAGAGINIAFNWLLIPTALGALGAAIATLVSYLTVFLLRSGSVIKLMPFSLGRVRISLSGIVICMQSLFLLFGLPMQGFVQLGCVALLLVINGKELVSVIRNLNILRNKDWR